MSICQHCDTRIHFDTRWNQWQGTITLLHTCGQSPTHRHEPVPVSDSTQARLDIEADLLALAVANLKEQQ